jgi:tetratricopeptide (TPR) repeat protein
LHFRGRDAEARKEQNAAIELLDQLVADFSDVPKFRVKLGLYVFNIGDHTHRAGKPADAMEWYDRAIRTLDVPAVRQMGNADADNFLQEAYRGRAKAFDELQRFAEADKDWARTLELTAEPKRSGVRMNRACSRVRVGQIDAPLREVEELLRAKATAVNNGEAGSLYDAACAYALAARPVEAVSAEKREEYAKRAVELLKLAVAKGFQPLGQLKIDRDLTALRGRADYRALMTGLETKPQLAPPPREVK